MDLDVDREMSEALHSFDSELSLAPTPSVDLGSRLERPDAGHGAVTSQAFLSANEMGARLPIVLIHGWHEEVDYFDRLAANVGPDQPMFAIPAAPIEAVRSFRGIADWAGYYRAQLAALPIAPPYNLLGWSFAGLVTMELADQLGDDARVVCLLDSWYPHNHYAPLDRAVFIANRYLAHVRHGERLSWDYFLKKELRGQSRTMGHIRSHVMFLLKKYLGLAASLSEPDERAWLILRWVNLRYSAKPITQPVVLITCRGTERIQGVDPTWDWSRLFVGGFETFHLDCSHFDVWSNQSCNVELADILEHHVSQSSVA